MYALSAPPTVGRPTRPTRGSRRTRPLPPSRVSPSRVEAPGRAAGAVRRTPRPGPRRVGAATYRRRRLVAAAVAVVAIMAIGGTAGSAAVPLTERLTGSVTLVGWVAAAAWLWRWDRRRPRRLPAR